jgi:hypothetical protein
MTAPSANASATDGMTSPATQTGKARAAASRQHGHKSKHDVIRARFGVFESTPF